MRAWLFTILRNTYFSIQRKRGREVQDSAGMHAERMGVAPSQEGVVDLADFRRALAKLSEEQREVLIMVGVSGISYEEAAEICGVAVGTVKSRVNRARNSSPNCSASWTRPRSVRTATRSASRAAREPRSAGCDKVPERGRIERPRSELSGKRDVFLATDGQDEGRPGPRRPARFSKEGPSHETLAPARLRLRRPARRPCFFAVDDADVALQPDPVFADHDDAEQRHVVGYNGARAGLDHQHCADQRHHHDHGSATGMWYTAPITTGQHRASDLINQSVITAPTSASVR